MNEIWQRCFPTVICNYIRIFAKNVSFNVCYSTSDMIFMYRSSSDLVSIVELTIQLQECYSNSETFCFLSYKIKLIEWLKSDSHTHTQYH